MLAFRTAIVSGDAGTRAMIGPGDVEVDSTRVGLQLCRQIGVVSSSDDGIFGTPLRFDRAYQHRALRGEMVPSGAWGSLGPGLLLGLYRSQCQAQAADRPIRLVHRYLRSSTHLAFLLVMFRDQIWPMPLFLFFSSPRWTLEARAHTTLAPFRAWGTS